MTATSNAAAEPQVEPEVEPLVEPVYIYRGTVLRWVDGDTVDITVDVGFYIDTSRRLRLNGVDTPEKGQPNYAEARAFCEGMAPEGGEVVIRTFKSGKREKYKTDKYGRFLAEVWANGKSVNKGLLTTGLAVPYFGGKKAKPPPVPMN